MINKVQVDVFGLTDRGMSQGAFALLLKESDGHRKMPIIIGVPEAQAIANELEGVRAQRPMTHDLLKSVIDALGAQLQEVWIHTLRDGTFYATLLFAVSQIEVDARPSDAIAIAVRCGVPIYVAEEILAEAALEVEAESSSDDEDDSEEESIEHVDIDDSTSSMIDGDDVSPKRTEPLTYRERLEEELRMAIGKEDYETAARLRDELSSHDTPEDER